MSSALELTAKRMAVMISGEAMRKAEEYQRVAQARNATRLIRDNILVDLLCLHLAAEQSGENFPIGTVTRTYQVRPYFESLRKIRKLLNIGEPLLTFETLAVRLGSESLVPTAIGLKAQFLMKYAKDMESKSAARSLIQSNESELNAAIFLVSYAARNHLSKRLPSNIKREIYALGISQAALSNLMETIRTLCLDDLEDIKKMNSALNLTPSDESRKSSIASLDSSTTTTTSTTTSTAVVPSISTSSIESLSSTKSFTTDSLANNRSRRSRKSTTIKSINDQNEMQITKSNQIKDITESVERTNSKSKSGIRSMKVSSSVRNPNDEEEEETAESVLAAAIGSNQMETMVVKDRFSRKRNKKPEAVDDLSQATTLSSRMANARAKEARNLNFSGINPMLPLRRRHETAKYKQYLAWRTKLEQNISKDILSQYSTISTTV